MRSDSALVFSIALLWAMPLHAVVLADRHVESECILPVEPIAPLAPSATEIIPVLLDWIEDATSYSVDDLRATPPTITFCEVGDEVPYEAGTALVQGSLNGAYDQTRNQILLVRPWSLANPRDLSVLLHELIHAVQLANRSYYCLEEPEWEAYKLQDRYLSEHGVEAEFDWLQIYFWSQCPRDIHP